MAPKEAIREYLIRTGQVFWEFFFEQLGTCEDATCKSAREMCGSLWSKMFMAGVVPQQRVILVSAWQFWDGIWTWCVIQWVLPWDIWDSMSHYVFFHAKRLQPLLRCTTFTYLSDARCQAEDFGLMASLTYELLGLKMRIRRGER